MGDPPLEKNDVTCAGPTCIIMLASFSLHLTDVAFILSTDFPRKVMGMHNGLLPTHSYGNE